MVIDFHTHIFPDKVAERAVSHLEKTAGITAYTRGTLKELRASMARSGVDVSVTLPVATSPEQVQSINRFAISLQQEAGIVSFGCMHPCFAGIEQELTRLREAGIKGIKLHPDYQEAYIDSPEMLRILACAGDLDLIVVVHGGFDDAFEELTHCTPKRAKNARAAMKGGALVVAHYGGNEPPPRLQGKVPGGYLAQVKQWLYDADVYIDTSYTHTMGHREACADILRTFDPERILYATDSPWDDQKEDLDFLRSLEMGTTWEEKVFSGNARRLLGI